MIVVETMQPTHHHNHQERSDGLYFKIVCDPGHERTTRELRQLPRESREKVWADMTGDSTSTHYSSATGSVATAVEDPLVVQQALATLDQELGKATSVIMDLALQQTKVANDPAFRLSFLRVDDLDPYRAAQRIVRHFEQKHHLFGASKLGSDIRLKDLSEDDLESLYCGGLQFLPQTDRGGRLVMVSRYRNFVYKQKENMLRALWYMFMSTIEISAFPNVDMVIVGYEVGDFVPVDYELTRQMIKLGRNFPIRVVASHSCYSDGPMQKVMDVVVHMVTPFLRLRFRIHNGSHQECRYRLLTMGIPVDYLPVTTEGVLRTVNHQHWLRFRIQQEQLQEHLTRPAAPQQAEAVHALHTVEDNDSDDDGDEAMEL